MKRFTSKILAIVALGLACGACGCRSEITTDYAYNALARSEMLELHYPGFLVGVEKRPRIEVSGPDGGYDEGRFRLLDPGVPRADRRNRELRDVTDDPEVALVTHVVSFDSDGGRRSRHYEYNAYDPASGSRNLDYGDGFAALTKLESALADRVAKEEPTDVIVIAMGWHNDQFESIRRFNVIVENVERAASGQDFRPLVLGVTWPSAWFQLSENRLVEGLVGHVGSYPVKANDADEVGFTVVNWLVNQTLPRALPEEGGPRVTVIGHSFGARVLSRAVFSAGHLVSPVDGARADLFVGLQPAFSINRFIDGSGVEGSPYAEFAASGIPIVMTSSMSDTANPMARFATGAKHVGGEPGLKRARQHPDLFCIVQWVSDSEHSGRPDGCSGTRPERVTVVDASAIVKDHNDVLGAPMGRLIWHFMREH